MSASDQKRGLETIGRWYWRYFGIGRSDKRRSMQRDTNLAGHPFFFSKVTRFLLMSLNSWTQFGQ
jgi:hypothetical protein